MNPEQISAAGPQRQLAETPLLLQDAARLRQHLQRLEQRRRRGQPVDRSLTAWQQELDAATRRLLAFQASRPRLEYPEDLPVSRERAQILEALKKHPVVILCGDTGSGKTTQLPKMVLEAGGGDLGRIAVTQPRRLAATGMARRVAEECGCELGQAVGVRVRFEERVSRNTRIEFLTDGMLLASLPQDPDWLAYQTVIVDEAHERSLNIDFILGCLHRLRSRRPDLRIVISSATLDAERFSSFFDGAPILTVEGRLYPIEDITLPEAEADSRDLAERVLDGLQYIDRHHGPLDTLVFLPGEREIRDCLRKLTGVYQHQADLLPLFARLSLPDQQRVFRPAGRRRIILATNVAETSITLPNIRAVIDSGEVRVHRVHPQSQVQRLVTESVSQASARQRRGRCGRTGPGVCLRLYPEARLDEAPAYSDPEIRRSSLAEVILRMASLGLPPLTDFPLIDPPRGAFVAEGYRTLTEIGAMTERRELTDLGRRLATFPLEPRLARMLEEGHREKVLPAVLVVAVLLSMQDPRERPADRAEAADQAHAQWRDPTSDFLTMVNLWNALQQAGGSRTQRRRFCERHFLNPRRAEEWLHLVDDLREDCVDQGWDLPETIGEIEVIDSDGLHRALLAGAPKVVGQREDGNLYRGPGGQRFAIFPGSGLAKKPPKWVMGFTLLETGRLYIREAATLNPLWIEDIAPHLCKYQYEKPLWNPERGFAEAEEHVRLGQLTLRYGTRVHYGRVDPAAARDIFIRDGLCQADLHLQHADWKRYLARLGSLNAWEIKLRRPGYFTGSDALYRHFQQVIPTDCHSTLAFQQWIRHNRWVPEISALFPGEAFPESDYPDELQLHGARILLKYAYTPDQPESDGLTLRVRDSDLAGLPDELLEWTIPAWLPEKIEALIRSLDKPLRHACHPLPQTAAAALAWMQEQGFVWTHSLQQALAAFLAAKLNRILAAPDLHPERLPPHLRTHLLVVDAKGRPSYTGDSFPGRHTLAAQPKVLQSRQSGAWHLSGLREWPDTELPRSIDWKGQTRYPALVDEGDTLGLRLFTHAGAADAAHQRAVIRLFRLRHPDPVRYLQKKLPLPTSLQLDLAGLKAEGSDALEDVLNSIFAEALGCPRDAETFARAADHARGILFEIAEERSRQLQQIFSLRSQVNDRLRPDFPSDLELQQTTLWAPGWVSDPINLQRYPRYLQATLLRIERLLRDPAKDARKRAELDPALTLIASAADRLPPAVLREAFRKIEELRIVLFAPELRPFEKMSLKRLESWLQEA